MKSCQNTSCGAAHRSNKLTDENISGDAALKKIINKFLVMSGKGGVGKTSVSVNLAIALANKGFQVGLMDVDIHGPNVPRMLGLNERLFFNQERKLIQLQWDNNLRVVSIEGLISSKDDAIIWRGPMKYSLIKQFIGEVQWGVLDFLVIDSPPGTGDEPLTVGQMITDARAIIVTTPQEVALADARKSISFCKTLKMEIAGIIENMSGCVCPRCGETFTLFGSGGGELTAKVNNIPFLGKLPFDSRMVVCGDSGTNFQRQYSDAEISSKFAALAEKLSSQVSHPQ
jgi:Mrp family chromosome partitioning ATPase